MSTTPARGMRDFLPEDVRRRQYVIGVIADVFQRYGFEPLETPAVENIETLLGKYGEEGDKLIFKILKRGEGEATGEADLALRYDLTVPLARVVAEYRAKLPKFFKRYQVQPVWRADRPQKGRFREFYQCDVDTIGSKSMLVDVELLAAASDVFLRLGFQDFRIRLNHRLVLTGLLEALAVPDELHSKTLVLLDKLDKDGPIEVREGLARIGVSDYSAVGLMPIVVNLSALKAVADVSERNREVLSILEPHMARTASGSAGVSGLREILRLAEATSAKGCIQLDPSLARGLSYYTGPVFEITVPDLSGSLGGGGRYDDLIGMFLGEQVPATGISLGLERILVVMAERKMFPAALTSTAADVMVTVWSAERTAETLALASELRAAGLRVDVYPEADKLGKQFKYASSRDVPFVLILGDDEVARGQVAVKNLTTGEQTAVSRAAVAEFIRQGRPA
jgi:histidyl-tRNA synthetase